MSAGRTVYQLGFEISPIILVNGIASNVPYQMLPIVALTNAISFPVGLFGGSDVTDLDDYFAHWKPMPGGTLVAQAAGMYPFANQATAANAVIAQPLNISMLMICPAQISYAVKLATMMVLQQTLAQHNASGGTYIVATPAGIYTNCLLLKISDVSSGESKQPQYMYQFDFIQPLITTSSAAQVLNSLMSKISGGLPNSLTPSWSGVASSVGSNVAGVGGSVFPVSSSLVGASVPSVSQNTVGGVLGGGA